MPAQPTAVGPPQIHPLGSLISFIARGEGAESFSKFCSRLVERGYKAFFCRQEKTRNVSKKCFLSCNQIEIELPSDFFLLDIKFTKTRLYSIKLFISV